MIILPAKVAGPDNMDKVPPAGEGKRSVDVPLQYNPPGLKVGVPETSTVAVVAPQIYTIAVAKV